MLLDKIINSVELKKFFEKNYDILLAFVFGSVAKGRERDESDIDIAILFSKSPSFDASFKIKDEISDILKKEVDLAILNDTSPILGMQVLKYGKLLFERNKGEYSKFFVKTMNFYYDLKTCRVENEKKILKGRIYG